MSTNLSFDPRDPFFELPGTDVRYAVQVFTAQGAYVVDPETMGLARPGRQRPAPGAVSVRVDAEPGRWRFHIEATQPEGVKAVKLLLRGLPGDGWWTATTPRSSPEARAPFQWTYPGLEWATPWACAGGFTLAARDPLVRSKRLHVSHPPYADGPLVELVHHERADRRGPRCVVPELVLTECEDPEADFEEHLAFLEESHGLRPFAERPDAPEWLDGIRLVLTLHGQHWTGHVFNTFAEMEEALRFVAGEIDGRSVLVYLPGWEGRYYHVYPLYRPGEELGGADGLRSLVATAHELGMRVMPMFGAHGANVANYPEWEEAALRNDTNRYLALVNAPDWDGDRAGEGDQIFLNPGEPGFGEHLARSIAEIVDEFGVDAAFLDTAGCWFDDPRHDVVDGLRRLTERLHAAHPQLLVAAEGWFDALLGIFPLAQQWLFVDRDLRLPQLLTRYARTTGHLAEPAPGAGSTGVHEAGFLPRGPGLALPGHVPAVSVVDDTLRLHADELAARCRAAGAACAS